MSRRDREVMTRPSRDARKCKAERDLRAQRGPVSFAPGAGLAASKVRGSGVKCAGCSSAVLPECAACGAPTVVVLDRDQLHALPLCRRCALTLVRARQECKYEASEAARAKMVAAATGRTHKPAPAIRAKDGAA